MTENVTDSFDRSELNFVLRVKGAFSFLVEEGFTEVEALPTLVRYRKGGVEVDVYHGRQSYEIGGGVSIFGTRYAMSELVRVSDPEVASRYRNAVATTSEGVVAGLEELSVLMRRYGAEAFRGDSQFLVTLGIARSNWAREYALEVLAGQLRSKAEDAFRRGDYLVAADLYGRIRDCLSPAEIKKLTLAEARSKV